MQDCPRSLADLGQQVGLSVSGVKERLRKLRYRGDVRAYVALMNPQTLGYDACAFVRIVVEGKKNERTLTASLLGMRSCRNAIMSPASFRTSSKSGPATWSTWNNSWRTGSRSCRACCGSKRW